MTKAETVPGQEALSTGKLSVFRDVEVDQSFDDVMLCLNWLSDKLPTLNYQPAEHWHVTLARYQFEVPNQDQINPTATADYLKTLTKDSDRISVPTVAFRLLGNFENPKLGIALARVDLDRETDHLVGSLGIRKRYLKSNKRFHITLCSFESLTDSERSLLEDFVNEPRMEWALPYEVTLDTPKVEVAVDTID